MKNGSVYKGEVIGFTAGRLFAKAVDIISVTFETQEEAEKWCDNMNKTTSAPLSFFPIKLESLSNTYVPEKKYD